MGLCSAAYLRPVVPAILCNTVMVFAVQSAVRMACLTDTQFELNIHVGTWLSQLSVAAAIVSWGSGTVTGRHSSAVDKSCKLLELSRLTLNDASGLLCGTRMGDAPCMQTALPTTAPQFPGHCISACARQVLPLSPLHSPGCTDPCPPVRHWPLRTCTSR